MGLLDSFEKGLERAVNGAFAKTFRSGIQPVEIASALRTELDRKAVVVARDRILAPNTLAVRLAPSDAERMRTLGSTLDEELRALVEKHARAQGYSFPGPLTLTIDADPHLSTGTIEVDARTSSGPVTWEGVLDIAGRRHPLRSSRTVIGRGRDADITIEDAGASRRHAEVLWDGTRALVRDLGSTNGTKVAGRRITESALTPDAVFTIGTTDVVFRVVAKAAPAAPAEPATRLFDVGGPL